MKPKTIYLFTSFLAILALVIWVTNIQRRTTVTPQSGTALDTSIKQRPVDNNKKTGDIRPGNIAQTIQNPRDTNVVMYFKNLSNVYNYKIIDKGFSHGRARYFDSARRVIKIYSKTDSLIQKIYPTLDDIPIYFYSKKGSLGKLSRSYITGQNAQSESGDDYFGELVVADFNFDGLEDFATAIGHGADNGSHYAYYIQNENHRFEYNAYLTENVIWFPQEINDSLKTFTTLVPWTMVGLCHKTFKYYPGRKKWRVTKDYVEDVRTGKLLKY